MYRDLSGKWREDYTDPDETEQEAAERRHKETLEEIRNSNPLYIGWSGFVALMIVLYFLH